MNNEEKTPEQKAIELVGNLLCYTKDIDLVLAKKFALISVEEILMAITEFKDCDYYLNNVKYWKEVIKEIEKI
jgi:hypothetical protein